MKRIWMRSSSWLWMAVWSWSSKYSNFLSMASHFSPSSEERSQDSWPEKNKKIACKLLTFSGPRAHLYYTQWCPGGRLTSRVLPASAHQENHARTLVFPGGHSWEDMNQFQVITERRAPRVTSLIWSFQSAISRMSTPNIKWSKGKPECPTCICGQTHNVIGIRNEVGLGRIMGATRLNLQEQSIPLRTQKPNRAAGVSSHSSHSAWKLEN